MKGRLYLLLSKYQIPSKYIQFQIKFTGFLFCFALTCHVTYCHESLDVASNQKKLQMVTLCMRGVNTTGDNIFVDFFLKHDKWHYPHHSRFKYYVYITDHLHINNYVRGTLENKNCITFLCSA